MNKLTKFGLFAAVGAIIGVGISLVSSHFGSSCSIMCNQWLAGGFGAMFGGVMSLDEKRKQHNG